MKKTIWIIAMFIICLNVNDCMEKAEKVFGVYGAMMYIQAAQVYATQELAKKIGERL